MKESMAVRVGRIISGGFNALVDSMENAVPEVVMEEAIREVDGAVDEVRAELGKVIAGKHLATRRIEQERQRHTELTAQVELAVSQGREDLAEAGVARQLDIEAQLPVLEKSVTELSAREQELEGYVEALKAKKREMQDELKEFRAARAEAPAVAVASAAAPGAAKTDKATAAFERIMERNTGVPGRGGDAKDAAKLAELEELSRQNRIRERLAAIKAGTGQ